MFLGSSRFLFHRSHLLQGDLSSERDELRRDQRARRGVGVATKFLKPSRRMMFIQSEMSSTRRHDGALCASRNRSHRHLGRRYAFVMFRFRTDGRWNARGRVIRQFRPHTALWSGRADRRGLAQLVGFAATKARSVHFWAPRRHHRQCPSPKLSKLKYQGCLLRNLNAELTWPKI